jgi:ribokinase
VGDVLVLGSLMTDLVARAPRMPLPGESLLGDDFGTFIGGKGCNQAIAAARMGASVALIGAVGADAFGDAFFPLLEREHVDARHVARLAEAGTGVASILVLTELGQNTIVATPRANFALTREMVAPAFAGRATDGSDRAVFLTQCETSLQSVEAGLHLARAHGMRTILNAAPIPRAPIAHLLLLADLLVVNETEASALAGMPVTSPDDAPATAERLLTLGPAEVVITLGAQGCLWSRAEPVGPPAPRHTLLPAIAVKQVDATAAGDAFCGTLAAALAEGTAMPQALRLAGAAGALAATRMGAVPSLPTADEVHALLARAGTL